MRTIKLSILSLLLFSSLSALGEQCYNKAGKKIPNSVYTYTRVDSMHTCTCTGGFKYTDNNSSDKVIGNVFTGTCTPIENSSATISPAAWAVPVAIVSVAIASGAGYYFYKSNFFSLHANLNENIVARNIRHINEEGRELFDSGNSEGTTSEIQQLRSEYDPLVPSGENPSSSMTMEEFSLGKPIDELEIIPEEMSFADAPFNESLLETTVPIADRRLKDKDWHWLWDKDNEVKPGEDLLSKIEKQIQDVREAYKAAGGENIEMEEMFPKQSISNPEIPGIPDAAIGTNPPKDIEKWNRDKELTEEEGETCF